MYAGEAPKKHQEIKFFATSVEVHDPEKHKDAYEIQRAKEPEFNDDYKGASLSPPPDKTPELIWLGKMEDAIAPPQPQKKANEQRAENSLPPLKESEGYGKPIATDLIPTLLLERQVEIENKNFFENSLVLVKVDTENNPYMTESVMERLRKEIQSLTSSKVLVLDKNISLEIVPLNQYAPTQNNTPTQAPKQPEAPKQPTSTLPAEDKESPAETFFSLQFSQKGTESIRVAIFLWIAGLLIAWFLR